MIADLATWQRLMDPAMEGLRTAAASGKAGVGVAEVERLRKGHSPELVSVALELAEARRRAAAKFGVDVAARLVADRVGVEMASSAAVSRHKARRVADAAGQGAMVADLCCGIGGDAMALRELGLEVIGVDSDPVRAWMCGVNAGCAAVCARVENAAAWSAPWFHLDPERRTSGAIRIYTLEELSPGPAVWRAVIEFARSSAEDGRWGGAIKLGPGAEPAEVQAALGGELPFELEYISQEGRMSQAVAWVGALAGEGKVRATAILNGRSNSIADHSGDPPIDVLGAFIVETDDAIERAGLLGAICRKNEMWSFCPGLGLLSANRPVRDEWCRSFEVLARMPWNEKRVRGWLREHDGGIVEVKTRAGSAQPEMLQYSLRGAGSTVYTVFVLRIGRATEAFITRRIDRCPSA